MDVALITANFSTSRYVVETNNLNLEKISGELTVGLEGHAPEDDLQTILEKEQAFEAQMGKATRVQEDVLETVFLGSDKKSKPVNINTKLDGMFRTALVDLLQEFIDVFAWDYSEMKGLDPKLYQHKIYLKPEAIPSRYQRYRMNLHIAKQVKE